jgi:membrane-bound lytic murein transglycosylase D
MRALRRALPALLACAFAGAAGASPAPLPSTGPGVAPPGTDAPDAPARAAPGGLRNAGQAQGSPAAASSPPADMLAFATTGGDEAGLAPVSPISPVAPAASTPLAPAADARGDAATLAGAPAPVALAQGPEPQPAHSVTRGDEVFARIRRNLGGQVCLAGGNSEKWRRRYAANPGMFANRLEQILPLLDFVSTEVERVGLPSEFVFIPLVESWYKPDAMGAGGPAGMWQMIGSTAKNHGIHIEPGYDGRLSPVESTRAALSYLKTLHAMFGNWEATVMAYNAGEGRMMQAFKRARSRDTSGDRRRPHGLSNITYDYVSKLQALSCLVSQPERHALKLPRASRFVPLAPVLMEPGVASIEQFAGRRGRNAAELRRLNPGYKAGRVVAGVPRMVLMPLGARQADAMHANAGPVSTAVAANAALAAAPVAGDAEVLATSANATLLAVSSEIAASAPVEVPVSNEVEAAPPPAATLATAIAPAVHHVVAGESLWSIANLYRLSVEDLRVLNRLERRAVVHAGDTLKLSP